MSRTLAISYQYYNAVETIMDCFKVDNLRHTFGYFQVKKVV